MQLTIPGFPQKSEVPMRHYECECGGVTFRILDYSIECAACGERYQDQALPCWEFNASREQLKTV